MKLGKLFFGVTASALSVSAFQHRRLLAAIYELEKVQGNLFVRINSLTDRILYLSKNDKQSDELFRDWISYKGWHATDQIGEGFFFINDKQQTLTLEREAVCGGRYILWTASAPIEVEA